MVLSGALDPTQLGGAAPAAHAHDFVQVHYVGTGQHLLHVDGRDQVLRTGDALVISPGTVITSRGQSTDQDSELWTVLFTVDALPPGTADPFSSSRAHRLLLPFLVTGRGGHRTTVPVADRERWLGHLGDLRSELRERRDGHADAVRAHLTLLLVQLNRLDPGLGAPFRGDRDDVLHDAQRFVEARYRDPISLGDVADAVSLSGGHLATLLKQRTGRTAGQLITQRRMREARRLLADTDLAISDIAVRTGYPDPAYFARRFRAHFGMSASTYRATFTHGTLYLRSSGKPTMDGTAVSRHRRTAVARE